jgi:hypothetical protein
VHVDQDFVNLLMFVSLREAAPKNRLSKPKL